MKIHMFRKIYLKELKDVFRDSRTLLLTVFLPILMMTGLVFFYETMSSDGEDKTFRLAVPNTITENEERIFSVFDNIELVKTNNPEKMFESGDAVAAIIFSDDFVQHVENGEEAKVTVIGNSFSQNSSTLLSLVNQALASYEKNIVSNRLVETGTDPKLIQPFVIEQKEISDEGGGSFLLAMLVPMMLALAIGVGSGSSAYDLFAGEKERKTMEALLITPVNRTTLVLSKWLAISTIGIITGLITLLVVVFEISFFTENLKKGLSFGDDTLSIVSIAFLVILVFAMVNAAILMIASIAAKTIKEAQSYSTPVMMIMIFPTVYLSMIGINELGLFHFATPILNIFSILKELLFGIVNYQHVLLMVGSNIVTMFILFIIGRVMFMKDKWVMS